jgi:hypothetical protein
MQDLPNGKMFIDLCWKVMKINPNIFFLDYNDIGIVK